MVGSRFCSNVRWLPLTLHSRRVHNTEIPPNARPPASFPPTSAPQTTHAHPRTHSVAAPPTSRTTPRSPHPDMIISGAHMITRSHISERTDTDATCTHASARSHLLTAFSSPLQPVVGSWPPNNCSAQCPSAERLRWPRAPLPDAAASRARPRARVAELRRLEDGL